jgi:hypothetical protein
MSYCHVRLCCGNVFTEPLPSNGFTRHGILLCTSSYYTMFGVVNITMSRA